MSCFCQNSKHISFVWGDNDGPPMVRDRHVTVFDMLVVYMALRKWAADAKNKNDAVSAAITLFLESADSVGSDD